MVKSVYAVVRNNYEGEEWDSLWWTQEGARRCAERMNKKMRKELWELYRDDPPEERRYDSLKDIDNSNIDAWGVWGPITVHGSITR